jgi:hypothetical protein
MFDFRMGPTMMKAFSLILRESLNVRCVARLAQ